MRVPKSERHDWLDPECCSCPTCRDLRRRRVALRERQYMTGQEMYERGVRSWTDYRDEALLMGMKLANGR